METMVDRESMEDGARGLLFTRHVPGIVVEECNTERELAEILCKFENGYVQLSPHNKKHTLVVDFCSNVHGVPKFKKPQAALE